jgi:hypothetical protein
VVDGAENHTRIAAERYGILLLLLPDNEKRSNQQYHQEG